MGIQWVLYGRGGDNRHSVRSLMYGRPIGVGWGVAHNQGRPNHHQQRVSGGPGTDKAAPAARAARDIQVATGNG